MAEIETIEENPLSLPEVKEALDVIKKWDKALSPKAEKVVEYISKVNSFTPKQAKEMRKKLSESGVDRLKEKHISKIIDIMPKDSDSLKAIFVGESLTLRQEDLKKILECLK